MAGPDDRERQEGPGSDLSSAYRRAAPYLTASTQLVGSVAGMALLGWWGDSKLGHRVPWLLMAGAAAGMVGGFVSFFRTIAALGKGRDP